MRYLLDIVHGIANLVVDVWSEQAHDESAQKMHVQRCGKYILFHSPSRSAFRSAAGLMACVKTVLVMEPEEIFAVRVESKSRMPARFCLAPVNSSILAHLCTSIYIDQNLIMHILNVFNLPIFVFLRIVSLGQQLARYLEGDNIF